MLRPLAVAGLLAIIPAQVPLPAAAPHRLQVLEAPGGGVSTFRLHASGAAIRLEGGGVLSAGRDSALSAPLGLELEPGATATLEGAVTLLVLPDSTAAGTTTELRGPRIRIARDADGRYRVLEAHQGRQLTVRRF